MSIPERQWKLGEDLSTRDSLLDGVTFDELILQIHCNIPKDKITPECVRDQLHELLEGRMDDMWFLVWKNMDKIIEYSRDYYRD